MKKLWLLILLIAGPVVQTKESPIEIRPETLTEQTADFGQSYAKIRKHEGYYVNHPMDKGKETYAGITRLFNKNWKGWDYIDKATLRWNRPVTGRDSVITEFYVMDFYLDIWVREGFTNLKNQEIADYLFDTRVHLSKKYTVKLLNKTFKTHVNYRNDEWVTSNMDTLDLAKFKQARHDYYLRLIKKDSTQTIFKKNWLKRAKL